MWLCLCGCGYRLRLAGSGGHTGTVRCGTHAGGAELASKRVNARSPVRGSIVSIERIAPVLCADGACAGTSSSSSATAVGTGLLGWGVTTCRDAVLGAYWGFEAVWGAQRMVQHLVATTSWVPPRPGVPDCCSLLPCTRTTGSGAHSPPWPRSVPLAATTTVVYGHIGACLPVGQRQVRDGVFSTAVRRTLLLLGVQCRGSHLEGRRLLHSLLRWALLQQGDGGLAGAARRTLIRLGELWGLKLRIEIFLLLPLVRCHVLQDFVQLACHGGDNSTCVPKFHSVL